MHRFLPLCALVLLCGHVWAAEPEPLIFSDDFAGDKLSDVWEVHEGKWSVQNGVLMSENGGLISLKTPPGGRFRLEFELAFPSSWVSMIPFFSKPDDYGTLYLTQGYWESFEMQGESIANYVQRRDADILTGKEFHKVQIESDFGLVHLQFDGKVKGPATFSFRPGSRIAFRSLPGSGSLRIKQVRIHKTEPKKMRPLAEVPFSAFTQSDVLFDFQFAQKTDRKERLLADQASKSAILKYQFADGDVFESSFTRLPVNVADCSRMFCEIDGDQSENNFFVILHDASGEQHLAMKSNLTWKDWQEIGINLKPLLESPPRLERHVIHWGGDGNQKIDFPITAVDIGVSKRAGRTQGSGQIRMRQIRFAAESP